MLGSSPRLGHVVGAAFLWWYVSWSAKESLAVNWLPGRRVSSVRTDGSTALATAMWKSKSGCMKMEGLGDCGCQRILSQVRNRRICRVLRQRGIGSGRAMMEGGKSVRRDGSSATKTQNWAEGWSCSRGRRRMANGDFVPGPNTRFAGRDGAMRCAAVALSIASSTLFLCAVRRVSCDLRRQRERQYETRDKRWKMEQCVQYIRLGRAKAGEMKDLGVARNTLPFWASAAY